MNRSRARPAAALLAAALAVLGCRAEEAGGGSPAPEWTLQDLAGRKVSLRELRGRPVVLDFWATWCTPCEFQIPVLNELYERYGDRVEVIGVAVDIDGRDVVAPFAEAHRIAYRVLLGDEELAQRYGARGFPSLFVIAGDGNITVSHVGVVEAEELAAAVEAALRAGASPPSG